MSTLLIKNIRTLVSCDDADTVYEHVDLYAVDNMKAYSGKYNLYTNNCSQVSLRILADANIDDRELIFSAAEYISPKRAKKYISENIDNFMQTGMRYYKAALQIYNMLF